jgi:hypothetical protein
MAQSTRTGTPTRASGLPLSESLWFGSVMSGRWGWFSGGGGLTLLATVDPLGLTGFRCVAGRGAGAQAECGVTVLAWGVAGIRYPMPGRVEMMFGSPSLRLLMVTWTVLVRGRRFRPRPARGAVLRSALRGLQARAVRSVTGCSENGDDLLNRRRVGWICEALVPRWSALVVARQRGGFEPPSADASHPQ